MTFALIAGVAAPPCRSQDQAQLEWKFPKGREIHYRLSVTRTLRARPDQRQPLEKITLNIDLVWRVQEKRTSDGGQVSVTVRSAKVTPPAKYPVGHPSRVIFQRTEDTLTGVVWTIELRKNGDCRGLEIPESIRDLKPPRIASVAGGPFNEEFFSLLLGLITHLPEKPARPGDHWEDTLGNEGTATLFHATDLVTVKLNRESVYQGTEGSLHKIRRTGSMIITKKDMIITKKESPRFSRLEASDTWEGTVLFDAEQGHVVRCELLQKMDWSFHIDGKLERQYIETDLTLQAAPGPSGDVDVEVGAAPLPRMDPLRCRRSVLGRCDDFGVSRVVSASSCKRGR